MNPLIYEILATYPVVYFMRAYRPDSEPIPCFVDPDGTVRSRYGKSWRFNLSRVAEIRLRANENPTVYYDFP